MIGTKLNERYEIRAHLGDGSTSTVYQAFDSLLGRDVALKVLLPQVRDTTRKRFFQEATAAAQLNHPNIMAIHDIGEDQDRHFLIVEYVEGDSLSHYIPSSAEVVVRLGTQIALALDYAHEAQIIHRDIKPANIKVTPQGQVKIMDLGLALPREAKRVTQPGMVIGTPAYISPEQAQGLELDRRTDIYSLGIVLYEMATGQLPFNADDITALLLQHVQQPAPPPRLVVADIPIGLEHVILKALEKKANRRFQSCHALAQALQAALPGSQAQISHDAPTHSRRPAELVDTIQTDQLGSSGRQSSTVRIMMADDHTILRKTLVSFLETHDEYIIVGEAGDGDTALEQALEIQPDLLILDLNMPGRGGLDILPEIRSQVPNVKVLVLTGRDEDSYIMRALRRGANGYILKSADESELIDSINKVVQGEMVLGKGIAEKMVTGILGADGDQSRLDEMECQVLLYVAGGYENGDIARELNMSMTHLIEIIAGAMDKLHANDRYTAALAALRRGDIMLEDLHTLSAPPEK